MLKHSLLKKIVFNLNCSRFLDWKQRRNAHVVRISCWQLHEELPASTPAFGIYTWVYGWAVWRTRWSSSYFALFNRSYCSSFRRVIPLLRATLTYLLLKYSQCIKSQVAVLNCFEYPEIWYLFQSNSNFLTKIISFWLIIQKLLKLEMWFF